MLIFKICTALMAFTFTISSDEETAVTNITLGLILGDVNADMHYRLYVPAFDIALETIHQRVREQKLLPMNITYVLAVTDNDCGQTVMRAPGVASTLYHTYQLYAIFGPNCSPEAAPVADLAAYWNIPILTGTGPLRGYRSNSLLYPSLYSVYSTCTIGLLQPSSWTRHTFTGASWSQPLWIDSLVEILMSCRLGWMLVVSKIICR